MWSYAPPLVLWRSTRKLLTHLLQPLSLAQIMTTRPSLRVSCAAVDGQERAAALEKAIGRMGRGRSHWDRGRECLLRADTGQPLRSKAVIQNEGLTLAVSGRRSRPMEQRVKATASHVKVARLVLGRPRSSSLPSPIFRTTCLVGIQEVENRKKGSSGFEGFLRRAGR